MEGNLDPEFLAEIDYLIDWRNWLAHRNLRRRLVESTLSSETRTADIQDELIEIGDAFEACTLRIQQAGGEAVRTSD